MHIKAVYDKIRDIKCTQCTYASSRKESLVLHVRTVHNKENDHKCDLCGYASSDKRCLVAHKQDKQENANIKPFKCDKCSYASGLKNYLSSHIKSVHERDNAKILKCDASTCYSSFSSFFSAKILEKEKRSKQIEVLRDYFQKVPMSSYRVCVYMLMECTTLGNVVLQLIFLDWYLNNAVSQYGIYTLRWFIKDPTSRNDPLLLIFPRLTDCEVKIYGPGMVIFSYHNFQ